jgi:hypothetical protein
MDEREGPASISRVYAGGKLCGGTESG